MNYLEMAQAVDEAKATVERADLFVKKIAIMIEGKLRSGGVRPDILIAFKRELQNFDMRSCRWKD